MGSLLVITGPPGAGKSAVASIIADQRRRSVLVPGDSFFAFLAAGKIEPWLSEAHQQNEAVIRAAAAATGAFVHDGCDTIYEGVVGPWFVDTLATAAGLQALDYTILLPSIDTCLQRVCARQDHGFTDETAARHMHRDFAEATIDQRHIIDNGAKSASETAELILAARASGTLAYGIGQTRE
ncbi:MAG: hypothetical protein GY788_17265 [bacterium]|nr:hypothetical protein [bacterium]